MPTTLHYSLAAAKPVGLLSAELIITAVQLASSGTINA
jgi:hypothetical protein